MIIFKMSGLRQLVWVVSSIVLTGRPSRFGCVFDKLDCNIRTVDPEVVYQCSAPHRGTSVKLISAEELDELAVSVPELLHSVIFQSMALTYNK